MWYLIDVDYMVIDICSQLFGHMGFPNQELEYFESDQKNIIPGDHYIENEFILDSLKRFEIPAKTPLEILQEQFVILDDILDAVCNIKDNPPEIPRLDRIELKINEIIDWLITQGCELIEKLPV